MRIEDLDALAWSFAGEDAVTNLRSRRPRRRDDFLRLELDDGGAFVLQAFELALVDHAFELEAFRVAGNRIALRPEGVELRIGIASRLQRRIVPPRLRIAADVEHVVVMGVAAHPHRDELDERRPSSCASPLHGPRERRRNFIRIGTVDRDARYPVA